MDIYRAVRLAEELQTFILQYDADDLNHMYSKSIARLQRIKTACTYTFEHLDGLLESKASDDGADKSSLRSIDECVGSAYLIQSYMGQFLTPGVTITPDIEESLKMLSKTCNTVSDIVKNTIGPTNPVASSTQLAVQDLLSRYTDELTSLLAGTTSTESVDFNIPEATIIEQPQAATAQPSDSSDDINDESETKSNQKPKNSRDSINDHLDILEQYHDELTRFRDSIHDADQLSGSGEVPEQAITCARLLSSWLDTRFLNTNSKITFKFCEFSKLVRTIVLGYGRSVEHGTDSKFLLDFQSWIEYNKQNKTPYLLPRYLYMFYSNPRPDLITKTGLLLWQILYNYVFQSIFESHGYDTRSGLIQFGDVRNFMIDIGADTPAGYNFNLPPDTQWVDTNLTFGGGIE